MVKSKSYRIVSSSENNENREDSFEEIRDGDNQILPISELSNFTISVIGFLCITLPLTVIVYVAYLFRKKEEVPENDTSEIESDKVSTEE